MLTKSECVKSIRNFLQSKDPELKPECEICGRDKNLTNHHMYCLADLWNNYSKDNKLKPRFKEDMKSIREAFYKHYQTELSIVCTLCEYHHRLLHLRFGKSYHSSRVRTVANWIKSEQHSAKFDSPYEDLNLLNKARVKEWLWEKDELQEYMRLLYKSQPTEREQLRLERFNRIADDEKFIDALLGNYKRNPKPLTQSVERLMEKIIKEYALRRKNGDYGPRIYSLPN